VTYGRGTILLSPALKWSEMPGVNNDYALVAAIRANRRCVPIPTLAKDDVLAPGFRRDFDWKSAFTANDRDDAVAHLQPFQAPTEF
jgi:hypothetical protein